ncbi:DUF1904 family protein [Spiroplasma floricola]|uniref:DUF1904 family protein n=1 Tax=Spiroplasma floricola 23-6 TaxID=1336749 RepID=A0A2K8SC91_9MOLU|nr:DUF1904 family protein [Spiroplasma floricola]AUB31079.1 hypothetical protein SFLOR_v1c00160 [Spiroplasma floricola 23-6]
MPIFTFKGVSQNEVNKYFEKIEELASIIDTDIKKIVFWHDPSILIANGYEKNAIEISIKWIARPSKQEAVAKHIQSFFANISKNIYVTFRELNSFLYLNGECVG